MEIFHGTRQRFDHFDTSFKGTGEAGSVDGCWFTDNFIGARRHALYKNRNVGSPLVYRCELTPQVILADHSKALVDQPVIAALLKKHWPVALTCSLNGTLWHALDVPVYEKFKGKTEYRGCGVISREELLGLYAACGIHGVYDWESPDTDAYLAGKTTLLFDFTELIIKEVIEVDF